MKFANQPERNSESSLLSQLRDLTFSALSDIRLPPPDVFGHLADRQIRHCDLDRLNRSIRENWPGITSIHGGIDCCGKLYFDVRIPEYHHEIVKSLQPFVDWIRTDFPTLANLSFCFLPIDRNAVLQSTGQIYPSISR